MGGVAPEPPVTGDDVLGKHHPLVRRVRALRGDRELRDRERVFVAEGIRLAEEALDANTAGEVWIYLRLTLPED